jgi:hypothetical protein
MFIQLTVPFWYQNNKDWGYQDLFFEVEKGSDLTQNKVIEIVQELHEKDFNEIGYDGSWLEILNSIKKVEEWKFLSINYYSINSFVPGFDTFILKAPITWKNITFIKI